jgi:hypothetical protein
MNPSARDQVERACTELADTGEPVTFTAVVRRTGLARTTLRVDSSKRSA